MSLSTTTAVYSTIGIVAVCIGAMSAAVGVNLIKSSAILEAHKPLCSRRRLVVGTLLTTVFNSTLDAFAYSFVPVSVIAPFGGTCVVISALLARAGAFGPKETLSILQWISVAAVFVSVALVGVFSPRPAPITNATVIFASFDEPAFVAYQVLWGCVSSVAYAAMLLGVIKRTSLNSTAAFGIVAGLSSGITQVIMKALASVSAGATILHGPEHAWDHFPIRNPQLWRAIIQIALAAIVLLHSLNLCIVSTEVSVANAIYQSSLIVSGVAAGCAFWGDLDGTTALRGTMFAIGIVGVVCGAAVLLVTHKTKTRPSCHHDTAHTTTTELCLAEQSQVVLTN